MAVRLVFLVLLAVVSGGCFQGVRVDMTVPPDYVRGEVVFNGEVIGQFRTGHMGFRHERTQCLVQIKKDGRETLEFDLDLTQVEHKVYCFVRSDSARRLIVEVEPDGEESKIHVLATPVPATPSLPPPPEPST